MQTALRFADLNYFENASVASPPTASRLTSLWLWHCLPTSTYLSKHPYYLCNTFASTMLQIPRFISRQQFAVALVVLWRLCSPSSSSSELACPAPTAPCMNEENHAQCMELVKNGCEEFDAFVNCPLQFSCRKQFTTDACVTLLVFNDDQCTGKPLHKMTFPTSTKPGSVCCK